MTIRTRDQVFIKDYQGLPSCKLSVRCGKPSMNVDYFPDKKCFPHLCDFFHQGSPGANHLGVSENRYPIFQWILLIFPIKIAICGYPPFRQTHL